MKTHQDIDRRSLMLASAVVERIDRDPRRRGLLKARANCRRWLSRRDDRAIREWQEILGKSWAEIRLILLDDSEQARRLRQSTPFCGILTPRERWDIYRDFTRDETTGP
jgi:hypothetical protein